MAFLTATLALLIGPGIAAPSVEIWELSRQNVSPKTAATFDEFLDGNNFLEMDYKKTEPSAMRDGPHWSSLSVTYEDLSSHSVHFFVDSLPGDLRDIVAFIKTNGTQAV